MAEGQVVGAVDGGEVADVSRRGAVVEMRELRNGDEGGRVAGDAGVPGGAIIEVFGEGVVGAELEAVAEAAAEVELKAVVGAGAAGGPGGGVGDGGIELGGRGIVDGAIGDPGRAVPCTADGEGGLVEVAGEDLVGAMRADVGDGQRGGGGDLLLDVNRPSEDGGGAQVGLNGRGRDEAGGTRGWTADGYVGVRDRGVEGGGLIEAVVEVVEQRVVQTNTGANGGAAVAADVVGDAEAGLREGAGTVVSKGAGGDGGVRVDDAVLELVDAGAAVGLVPAVRGLETKTAADLEAGDGLPGVFDVAGAEPGTPVESGGLRDDGEGLDGALQEGGERGKGGLAELVLGEIVVRLEPLQPAADLKLVMTAGVEDVIVERVEIAGGGVVGADVGAGLGDLRAAVRRSGAGDDDGAYGFAGNEARCGDGGRAKEEELGAGEADRAVLSRREEKTCCSWRLAT